MEVLLKIQKLSDLEGFEVPKPMSEHASGMDLRAAIEEPILLKAGERALIPCGFAMEIPVGYEAQIRPRSGLAFRHGLTCLNTPGTIDADYRGEIKVLLANLGEKDFTIQAWDRIAQMVIQQVPQVKVEVVTSLSDTSRGEGGFGSTGV
ncbi:MAG: dUTP diphosphatase [Deltaproteobacteria bacterium]|nr:dUTP diphosphatase [Deltaproteobacteria bacterium]